jgi:hypothetical protein
VRVGREYNWEGVGKTRAKGKRRRENETQWNGKGKSGNVSLITENKTSPMMMVVCLCVAFTYILKVLIEFVRTGRHPARSTVSCVATLSIYRRTVHC